MALQLITKKNEKVIITLEDGRRILVEFIEYAGFDRAKLAITTPKGIVADRQEVWERKQLEKKHE